MSPSRARATLIGLRGRAPLVAARGPDRARPGRCRRSNSTAMWLRHRRPRSASPGSRRFGPRPRAPAQHRPRWSGLVGIAGIFGYHFLYFTALAHAPAAQANLINYLLAAAHRAVLRPPARASGSGPLHFVGRRPRLRRRPVRCCLRPGHRGQPAPRSAMPPRFGCAVVWATYSLLSRRLGGAPTDVGRRPSASRPAVLAAVAHLALETTVWPDGALRLGGGARRSASGRSALPSILWDIGREARRHPASWARQSYSGAAHLDAHPRHCRRGGGGGDWSSLIGAALLIAGGAALAARGSVARGRPDRSKPVSDLSG
jgi:hypothetical protein